MKALAALLLLTAAGSARAADPAPQPTTKVEVGGFIHLSSSLDGDAVAAPDLLLYGTDETDATFHMTARQSRIALKVTRPICSWSSELRLEADFFGGFPGGGSAETFPLPRLRVAAGTLTGAHGRVVVGQDWVPFAPANPDALSHQAVPMLAAAGNLWARQPQLTGVLVLPTGPLTLELSGAVVAPVDAENPPATANPFTFGPAVGAGERTARPAGEARVAATFKVGATPSSVGVSTHVGGERYLVAGGDKRDLTIWGVAFDFNLVLPVVRLTGEGYVGSGLGAFMGGVNHGVHRVPGATPEAPLADAVAVDSKGGWVEAIVQIVPALRLSAGIGYDDPDDADLVAGERADNRLVFGAATLVVAPLEVALELDGVHTGTAGGGRHDAVVGNLSVLLRF